MSQYYLGEDAIDQMPSEALTLMAQRLGAIVSLYFSAHPDEYARFLEDRGVNAKRIARENADVIESSQ